mgnify:CR=1 FL=1
MRWLWGQWRRSYRPPRPAGLIETAFDELAKRWKPILDAFDSNGVDVCYEIHPGEDLHDGVTFERFLAGDGAKVEIVYDDSRTDAGPAIRQAERLMRAFNRETGMLRMIARGVSPDLTEPVKVQHVNTATPRQKGAFLLFLIPMFAILSPFLGGMAVAIDSTAGERERGSLEPLLMNPAPRAALVLGKWAAVATVSGNVVTMHNIGTTTLTAIRANTPSLPAMTYTLVTGATWTRATDAAGKILVIDGRTGFTGGLNLAAPWLPVEDGFEKQLLDRLVGENRAFVKGLHYNLGRDNGIASAAMIVARQSRRKKNTTTTASTTDGDRSMRSPACARQEEVGWDTIIVDGLRP